MKTTAPKACLSAVALVAALGCGEQTGPLAPSRAARADLAALPRVRVPVAQRATPLAEPLGIPFARPVTVQQHLRALTGGTAPSDGSLYGAYVPGPDDLLGEGEAL